MSPIEEYQKQCKKIVRLGSTGMILSDYTLIFERTSVVAGMITVLLATYQKVMGSPISNIDLLPLALFLTTASLFIYIILLACLSLVKASLTGIQKTLLSRLETIQGLVLSSGLPIEESTESNLKNIH